AVFPSHPQPRSSPHAAGPESAPGGCFPRRDHQNAAGLFRHPRPLSQTSARPIPMSTSGAKSNLAGATRKLSDHWRETRKSWADQKAAEFEHLYLEELFHQVENSLRIIEELDQLLHKVH